MGCGGSKPVVPKAAAITPVAKAAASGAKAVVKTASSAVSSSVAKSNATKSDSKDKISDKKTGDDDDADDDAELETDYTELLGVITECAVKYGMVDLDPAAICQALSSVGVCNHEGLKLVISLLAKTHKDMDMHESVWDREDREDREDGRHVEGDSEDEEEGGEEGVTAAAPEAADVKKLSPAERKAAEKKLKKMSKKKPKKPTKKDKAKAAKAAKKKLKDDKKNAKKNAKAAKKAKSKSGNPQSGLEADWNDAEEKENEPRGYVNMHLTVELQKALKTALDKANCPMTFWAYLLGHIDGESVELRTWRLGAQLMNSHRIYLNSDGIIKETKSSKLISHEAYYYKCKTGITDFEKKSRWGSSAFTFINADTGKKLVFKKVKNAKEVFQFIEENILLLDFPTGGHF